MGMSSKFVLKSIGNEHMIISISSGNMDYSNVFNINETGAYIFNQLKEGKTKNEIVNSMNLIFDVNKEDLSKDVEEFILQLKIRGIYEE